MEAVRGGANLWIGCLLVMTALPVCVALAAIALDTPEEGRDSLRRICETNGSRTTCRPDPNVERPSELDRANRALERKR